MKKLVFITVSLISFIILNFTSAPAVAKKWIVKVSNNSFVPYNLTHVTAGDSIQWQWQEGVHTTTSTSVPEGADSWDHPISLYDQSFTYVPTVNGTYFYQCTPHAPNMNGIFLVTGASGVESITHKPEIRLYPNPFTDIITVQLPGTSNWVKSMQVFSMKGELLRIIRFNEGSHSEFISIDLSDLAPGAYTIQITDNRDRQLAKKIIRD